jgi:hypothetical protein
VIPFIPLRTKTEERPKTLSLYITVQNLCIVTPFTPLSAEKERWLETQWVAVFRFNTVNADVLWSKNTAKLGVTSLNLSNIYISKSQVLIQLAPMAKSWTAIVFSRG